MFDDFFIRALVAGIGIAFVTGPLGCFVVWRRLSYFGDTLAHSALLGVTMAYTFDLNIAISVLVAAVVLYGSSSIEGLGSALCWYVAGVVFFVNLAREIIKDCQDMEADGDSRQTLPIKIGKENSRMVAYVLTLLGIVFLYIPYWQGPFSFGQLLLQSPAIVMLISLNGPMWQGEDYKVATRLRISMLLGLAGFIVTILV